VATRPTFTLHCDVKRRGHCLGNLGAYDSRRALRCAARSQGWTRPFVGGKQCDSCPACAAVLEVALSAERAAFLERASDPTANITKLCREMHISRMTAYRWLAQARPALP